MNTTRPLADALAALGAACTTFAIFSGVVANAAPEQTVLMAKAQDAAPAVEPARAARPLLVALARAR